MGSRIEGLECIFNRGGSIPITVELTELSITLKVLSCFFLGFIYLSRNTFW